MRLSPRLLVLGCVLVAHAWLASAWELRDGVEREYQHPVAAVRAALQNVSGGSGSRLPSLEGFIKLEGIRIEDYERPYYEYKFEVEPGAEDKTVVRVRANVSAWYVGPDQSISGYRNLESNGRLENDLLDRLEEYLRTKSTDPAVLAQEIVQLRAQRKEVESRIARLEEAQASKQDGKPSLPDLVSVVKPRVPILGAPDDQGAVLLRSEPEDEFEVLERRGAWLRVKLEDERSGWIRRSQVEESGSATRPVAGAQAAPPVNLDAFTIIRESASEFSGDWPRLKGKKALYVWVRPVGSSLNVAATNKLRFAEATFSQRYREIAHSSQNELDGIVLIFLDQRGGVAAASMEDIGSWLDGSLSGPAFRKKCSFDPASAFESQNSPSGSAHDRVRGPGL